MAVTLPITDPILASLAALGPRSSDEEPGIGLYGQAVRSAAHGLNAPGRHEIATPTAAAATDAARGIDSPAEASAAGPAEHSGPPRYGDAVHSLRGAPALRQFWLEFDVAEQESPQPDGTPTKSFLLFPLLPTEIRMQVWEAALRHGRVITVTCRTADPVYLCECSLPPPKRPSPALPTLYRVSREAYGVARGHYVRAFDWRVPYSLADPDASRRPGGPGCLFDFAADVLLLQGDLEPRDGAVSTSMAYFLSKEDSQRVRHVACSAADLGVGKVQPEQLFVRLFPIIDRFAIRHRLFIVTPPESSSGTANQRQGDSIQPDNICQQVWSRWTNSQNMPHLVRREGHEETYERSDLYGSNGNGNDNGNDAHNMQATLYYSPSSRRYSFERNRKDQISIVAVAQDQLQAHTEQ